MTFTSSDLAVMDISGRGLEAGCTSSGHLMNVCITSSLPPPLITPAVNSTVPRCNKIQDSAQEWESTLV